MGIAMTALVVGVNHRSAPQEILESLTIGSDGIAKALTEVRNGPSINEAVVLSTCNRIEVYAHAERFHDAFTEIRDTLSVLGGLDADQFTEYLYVHHHTQATEHLFNVASGLDSVVLGEHEILGQLRQAWETAKAEGACGPLLNPMLQHAVSTGRRVRTDTAIGKRTASLSHAAVSLVSDRLGRLDGKNILLIGAGEVGSGIAKVMGTKNGVSVTVSNRTAETAEALAAELGAQSLAFQDLETGLTAADVVICATGAPSRVLDRKLLEAASGSTGRRLLILDLAVPRDVDPSVITLDWVDLLVLADLQEFVNRGIAGRHEEAAAAKLVVDSELERYRRAITEAEMEPLLGQLFRSAAAMRIEEKKRLERHHPDLGAAEWEAVDAVTKAVLTRFLHTPSSVLRDSAGSQRGDRLAEAVRELFDL